MLCYVMCVYAIFHHIIERQIRTGPIVLTPVVHFQVPYTVIVIVTIKVIVLVIVKW